jgi:hypothetical protein
MNPTHNKNLKTKNANERKKQNTLTHTSRLIEEEAAEVSFS